MNSDTLLQYLQNYGPIVLAAVLFLAGLGVPLPASLIVVAAGAFARQGYFSWPLAFGMTLMGAALGSSGSYLCGRSGVRWLIARLQNGKAWRKAEEIFRQRGTATIFLSHFLLTPLALPTNLIAGAEKYPFGKFITLCVFGESIWIAVYGGAGYAAGASWPLVQAHIGTYAHWTFPVAIVLFGIYELIVHWRRHLPTSPIAPPGPRTGTPAT